MAKKQVNWPGQFKLAGRERPGKDIPAALMKGKFGAQKAAERKMKSSGQRRKSG